MMNQRGSLTVDFVFGMVLASGVSLILISLCFTLAVVEVSQYVSFAASRVYFGGHRQEKDQIERAEAKFQELMSIPAMKQLLNGQWFSVKYIASGDFRSEYPSGGLINDQDVFFGTRLEIESKVLNLRIPFYGNVGNENGFRAKIQSFLGREPSFEECKNFNDQRWTRYQEIYQNFKPPTGQENSQAYVPIIDNGC
jgi:hypothetical protein